MKYGQGKYGTFKYGSLDQVVTVQTIKDYIKLFAPATTNFSGNGITILSNAINPTIIEELNGLYTLTLDYPIEAPISVNGIIPASKNTLVGTVIVGTVGITNLLPKSSYIQKDCIIVANGQPFRIFDISRSMSTITVNCRHIFYDLLDNFLEDCKITDLTGLQALQCILDNTQYPNNFTCSGDVASSNTIEFIQQNPIDALMGSTSLISNYQGELLRDNFDIGYWNARGNDNGVLIMGGKNLVGITDDLNEDNVCTRLMPTGDNGLLLTEKYIDSPYINSYPHPKIKVVNFSGITDEGILRTTAQAYMLAQAIDIPLVNYTVDFVMLSQMEEYKDYAVLETVDDGDIVTIKYDTLNLNIKAEVINTTKTYVNGIWLNNKVELGNFKGNIANTLNNIANVMTPTGDIKGSSVQGIIDMTKASLKAMSDSAIPQTSKAILFEDRDITSPTYGAMALGTSGFEISNTMTNGEWQYSTFGTGAGFIANCIIAGQILGNNAVFDLDAGSLKVTHADGSYTLLDSTGLNRFVSGTQEQYHYLSAVGVVNSSSSDILTITLPSEFVGKDFKVIACMSDIYITSSTQQLSEAYARIVPVAGQRLTGTFQIQVFVTYTDTGGGGFTPATASYVAIA